MNTFHFKLFLSESDIRRFALNRPVSFAQLHDTLKTYVNNQAGRFVYLDEDKEWISLNNQVDWDAATSMNQKVFKLRFEQSTKADASVVEKVTDKNVIVSSATVADKKNKRPFRDLAAIGEAGLRNMKADELTQWFPNLINRAKNQGKYQESMNAYELLRQFPGLFVRFRKCVENSEESSVVQTNEPVATKTEVIPSTPTVENVSRVAKGCNVSNNKRRAFVELVNVGESGLRAMKADELTQWFPNLINRAKNQGKYQESMTAYELIQQFPGLFQRFQKCANNKRDVNRAAHREAKREQREARREVKREQREIRRNDKRDTAVSAYSWTNRRQFIDACRTNQVDLSKLSSEELLKWFPCVRARVHQQGINKKIAAEILPMFPRLEAILSKTKKPRHEKKPCVYENKSQPQKQQFKRARQVYFQALSETAFLNMNAQACLKWFPGVDRRLSRHRPDVTAKLPEMNVSDLMQQCPRVQIKLAKIRAQ